MKKTTQNKLYDKEDIERSYNIEGLSPSQKADIIIKRIKRFYNLDGDLCDVIIYNTDLFAYLCSENCELTLEQKDFVIYCMFGALNPDAKDTSFAGEYTSHLKSFDAKLILDVLEQWGIIDGLKKYNDDEMAGIKWFESHKIPMQHVYRIINDRLFFPKNIIPKYPELRFLPTKYSQNKCERSVNEIGRVSGQQCAALLRQAIELVKNGDFDKSHYDLLTVMGPEKIYFSSHEISQLRSDLEKELRNQIMRINTKEKLLQYLKLERDFWWMGIWRLTYEYEQELHMLKLLGVDKKETNIENFDLKNSKDIARCKQLFPFALMYPFLFIEWYPRHGDGYNVNSTPIFVPEYDNGLEKKRKELSFKLSKDGVAGKIVSKTIVPKKLCNFGTKLEQFMADAIYRTRHPGRQ